MTNNEIGKVITITLLNKIQRDNNIAKAFEKVIIHYRK
ncbi:hypothetical protein P20495_1263 [Pseudoalteromonas sp. BSi20495]|nr:hypothetical protein P20495_1263 [Pseudoalteromonas sp. BSi20495]